MNKIEMGKKYRYRNGEPAKILSINASETNSPVISIDDCGNPRMHNVYGKHFVYNGEPSDYDLIEEKEVKKVKFRLFINEQGEVYAVKSDMSFIGLIPRIIAIKDLEIEYYDGEGLE